MKKIIGISVNSLRELSQKDVGQIGAEGQDWQLLACLLYTSDAADDSTEV